MPFFKTTNIRNTVSIIQADDELEALEIGASGYDYDLSKIIERTIFLKNDVEPFVFQTQDVEPATPVQVDENK